MKIRSVCLSEKLLLGNVFFFSFEYIAEVSKRFVILVRDMRTSFKNYENQGSIKEAIEIPILIFFILFKGVF